VAVALTRQSKIAFERVDDSDFEVFVMNADGTNPVNLTNRRGIIDTQPAWSPNGTRICFTSTGEGLPNVFVMEANGANVVQLTVDGGSNCAWSPDGNKIAFRSFRDGNQEIYVINANGSNETNLTNAPGSNEFNPSWSPNGDVIAFDSDRSGFAIWLMNPDGSDPVQITDGFHGDLEPRWLPDASKILFTRFSDGNAEVYLMNPDGTGAVNLSNNPGNDFTGGFVFF
jgi:Tol biopolymer transport system component